MDDATQPSWSGGELLAGKYRVERLIGSGGMGVVLAARHEGLNTNVAIKLLRGAALEHSDIVGRFMREARAAVSLRSEHVARVFDVGALEDGRPYIVMERLEGKDLGEVCEAETLPTIAESVDYVLQACEAIAEAHSLGIVHRDLKPKNLFLTRSVHGKPLVKVLDFGISKIESAPGEMQLTGTTEIIGSPSYMSPEQLRSARNVDMRTDIWALGVILYELLTGRVPFFAETVTELVLVVVTEPHPAVRSLRPTVPEELEAIIARCLSKKPDDRYQSVLDLVQALEPFTNLVPSASPSDRVRAVASGRPRNVNTAVSPGISAPPPAAGSSSGSSSGSVSATIALVQRPTPSTPSRVNVHGGTSVAWGDTQSAVQPIPSLPAPLPIAMVARSPYFAFIGIGVALALVVSAVTIFVTTRPPPPSHPPVAAAQNEAPLPPGRKDLPPTITPAPAPTPEPPVPSALPEDRKPGAIPAPAAPKPAAPARSATPAPKASADDLDGIGRR